MALPQPNKKTNDELQWNQSDGEGYYHMDDMRLNEVQFQQFYHTDEDKDSSRNAIAHEKYRWPNGDLKFFFAESITEEQKQKVRSAYTKFNAMFEGCLNIREISPLAPEDWNMVYLTNYGSGCHSSVGMQGQPQQLNLQAPCYSYRTIIHEFLHAFGLYHMQSRPDRDQYVDIVWDNIYSSKHHNYEKASTSLTFGVPYDGRSFMHYHSFTSFNINPYQPSIISKVNLKQCTTSKEIVEQRSKSISDC